MRVDERTIHTPVWNLKQLQAGESIAHPNCLGQAVGLSKRSCGCGLWEALDNYVDPTKGCE